MTFEQILYDVQGTTAVITLNRPERRNALSGIMLRELAAALSEADNTNAVHCIVLRGAGPDFCGGADLNEYSTDAGDTHRGRADIDDDIWRLAQGQKLRMTIFDMHKPVIAAVQGTVIGTGTSLVGLCDIVLIAEDARIGFPPVRDFGTPPDNTWLYNCGPQWAKRLLLTGDSVTGTDAAQIGLALKAVPRDALDSEVMKLAARMGMIDHHLLAANKRLVNLGLELMGARTMQRLCGELDARGHIAPKAREFAERMKTEGVKKAFRARDAAFGSGYANVSGLDPD